MTEEERIEKSEQLARLRRILPGLLRPVAETVYADIMSVALTEVVAALACTAIKENRRNISAKKLGEIYANLSTAIQQAIGDAVRANGIRVAGDCSEDE